MANKYGNKAKEIIHEVLREHKKGRLKVGSSEKKVKSRKQAVAIGISTACKKGAKVPKKKR